MTEYIGIEIERWGMNLAVVEAGRGQAVVAERRSVAFETPFSIEVLEKSISELLSGIEISSSSPAIISISPLMTAFRLIELPFSSESRIRQVIDFEMETLVPFQSEQIQTSFVRVSSLSSGISSYVFACCADGNGIDAITDAFKETGLEIVAVSVSGYASAALYALSCNTADSIHEPSPDICDGAVSSGRVYADIGEDSITIAIINHSEVVFARSLASVKGNEPDLFRIADEAARTVTYYSDFHDSGFGVCELSYSYSGMTGNGLKEKLENAFRSKGFSCRISEASCFDSCRDVRNVFSVASLFSSGKAFLNFVSTGFFRAGFFKNLKKNWTGSLVMAGCVILSALFYLGISEYSAWKKLERLDGEIRTVFMETFPDTKKIVDPYQQMAVKVNALMQNQGPDAEKGRVIDILREISSRIKPDTDITMTSFTVLPDEIQINGEAASFDLAETARKALEESGLFADVKVDSVNSDTKTGKIVFRLNLKREGQG